MVLQKSAVEISVVCSAILKTCVVDVFRSGHQYLTDIREVLILENCTLTSEKLSLIFKKGGVMYRKCTLSRLEVQSEFSGPSYVLN